MSYLSYFLICPTCLTHLTHLTHLNHLTLSFGSSPSIFATFFPKEVIILVLLVLLVLLILLVLLAQILQFLPHFFKGSYNTCLTCLNHLTCSFGSSPSIFATFFSKEIFCLNGLTYLTCLTCLISITHLTCLACLTRLNHLTCSFGSSPSIFATFFSKEVWSTILTPKWESATSSLDWVDLKR